MNCHITSNFRGYILLLLEQGVLMEVRVNLPDVFFTYLISGPYFNPARRVNYFPRAFYRWGKLNFYEVKKYTCHTGSAGTSGIEVPDEVCCFPVPKSVAFLLCYRKVIMTVLIITVTNIHWITENYQPCATCATASYIFKSQTTLWLRHWGLEKKSHLPKSI